MSSSLQRVYPRVCGGTSPVWSSIVSAVGLSPRVRGNHNTGYLLLLLSGSIPACAGEPGASSSQYCARGVYPRVCGGTKRGSHFDKPLLGLSPRVRGNHDLIASATSIIGSIPACAGEPPTRYPTRPAQWVYPRVCGGTIRICSHWCAIAGLSPRVRGNRSPRHRRGDPDGSIPACAGEPPA